MIILIISIFELLGYYRNVADPKLIIPNSFPNSRENSAALKAVYTWNIKGRIVFLRHDNIQGLSELVDAAQAL